MNSWFLVELCTLLGGTAISRTIAITTPQAQEIITNLLLAASVGIAAACVGYGLGRWQKTKTDNTSGPST